MNQHFPLLVRANRILQIDRYAAVRTLLHTLEDLENELAVTTAAFREATASR